MVKVGDVLPDCPLFLSRNPTDKNACAIPAKTTTSALFKNKRVILTGIPIPFSPTCHNDMMPSYIKLYEKFKSKGVDLVANITTFPVFIQDAWGKHLGANSHLLMLSDPNATLLSHLGLTMDTSHLPIPHGSCLARRFALVIEDMKVVYVGVEEVGKWGGEEGSVASATRVLAKL